MKIGKRWSEDRERKGVGREESEMKDGKEGSGARGRE